MMEDVMLEPRLWQVFLSQGFHGIFEVSIVPATQQLLCTCPGFENRRRCKHVDYVTSRFGADGEYWIEVSSTTTPEDIIAARSGSPEDWRHFVYMHTTPAVI